MTIPVNLFRLDKPMPGEDEIPRSEFPSWFRSSLVPESALGQSFALASMRREVKA